MEKTATATPERKKEIHESALVNIEYISRQFSVATPSGQLQFTLQLETEFVNEDDYVFAEVIRYVKDETGVLIYVWKITDDGQVQVITEQNCVEAVAHLAKTMPGGFHDVPKEVAEKLKQLVHSGAFGDGASFTDYEESSCRCGNSKTGHHLLRINAPKFRVVKINLRY